jgi:hypothetical protein
VLAVHRSVVCWQLLGEPAHGVAVVARMYGRACIAQCCIQCLSDKELHACRQCLMHCSCCWPGAGAVVVSGALVGDTCCSVLRIQGKQSALAVLGCRTYCVYLHWMQLHDVPALCQSQAVVGTACSRIPNLAHWARLQLKPCKCVELFAHPGKAHSCVTSTKTTSTNEACKQTNARRCLYSGFVRGSVTLVMQYNCPPSTRMS